MCFLKCIGAVKRRISDAIDSVFSIEFIVDEFFQQLIHERTAWFSCLLAIANVLAVSSVFLFPQAGIARILQLILLSISLLNTFLLFKSGKQHHLLNANKLSRPIIHTLSNDNETMVAPPTPEQMVNHPIPISNKYDLLSFTSGNQRTAQIAVATRGSRKKFRPVITINCWTFLPKQRDLFIFLNPIQLFLLFSSDAASFPFQLFLIVASYCVTLMTFYIFKCFEDREQDRELITKESFWIQQKSAERQLNMRREVEDPYVASLLNAQREEYLVCPKCTQNVKSHAIIPCGCVLCKDCSIIKAVGGRCQLCGEHADGKIRIKWEVEEGELR